MWGPPVRAGAGTASGRARCRLPRRAGSSLIVAEGGTLPYRPSTCHPEFLLAQPECGAAGRPRGPTLSVENSLCDRDLLPRGCLPRVAGVRAEPVRTSRCPGGTAGRRRRRPIRCSPSRRLTRTPRAAPRRFRASEADFVHRRDVPSTPILPRGGSRDPGFVGTRTSFG